MSAPTREQVVQHLRRLTHNGIMHLETDEICWLLDSSVVRDYFQYELMRELGKQKEQINELTGKVPSQTATSI